MKSGQTMLEEVPSPQVKSGSVLIKTSRSLVSLGTERMLVEFGKANLIEKARQQPDKVKQVLDKIKTDGLQPTLETVFNKLGQPLPLGYCNVGTVVAIGKGVTELKVGDRVASNGQHAEFVCVPKNLVAKVPDNVSDEETAFTVIGSIGLQGIRLLNPQLGETVVVTGLGLIGLIAAQLLKANGCKVIGIDFDEEKIQLARAKGIVAINPAKGTDPVKFVMEETDQIGADAVLITASAKTNDVIHQAAEMSRKRGRIVLVGVIGLDIRRDDFYKKELTFQVSCSYGPGRYDENYENKGIDYPLPFVRWTEKRNFDTILQAISMGNLDVKSLITEEVELKDYNLIYGDMRKHGSIASIIKYPEDTVADSVIDVNSSTFSASAGQIGIIGAGNFTSATMIPALMKAKAKIRYIASAQGLSAKILAKKSGALKATSDYKEILSDKEVDLVMITTRHNLHASMVLESLQAGKSVFVEKPLCLTDQELQEITNAYKKVSGKGITWKIQRNCPPVSNVNCPPCFIFFKLIKSSLPKVLCSLPVCWGYYLSFLVNIVILFFTLQLSDRVPMQFYPDSLVNDPVQYRIGYCFFSDNIIPSIHRQLRCDECGFLTVPVFYDVHQIHSCSVIKRLYPEVIQYKQVRTLDPFQLLQYASFRFSHLELPHQFGCICILHFHPFLASLVSQCGSYITLARS